MMSLDLRGLVRPYNDMFLPERGEFIARIRESRKTANVDAPKVARSAGPGRTKMKAAEKILRKLPKMSSAEKAALFKAIQGINKDKQ